MSTKKTCMSEKESAGRYLYEIFWNHYKRIHGVKLPVYDELVSKTAEVWNETATSMLSSGPGDYV